MPPIRFTFKGEPDHADLTWQEKAACAGTDPGTFFHVSYRHTEGHRGCHVCAAQRVCAGCPVTRQCLGYVMRTEHGYAENRDGIWAGLTPYLRQKLWLTHREQVAS
jgi:hypothetical protein